MDDTRENSRCANLAKTFSRLISRVDENARELQANREQKLELDPANSLFVWPGHYVQVLDLKSIPVILFCGGQNNAVEALGSDSLKSKTK